MAAKLINMRVSVEEREDATKGVQLRMQGIFQQ